ncbi:MAG: tetratricopeptide repeat protein [Anaerolineae bacterium]
MAGDQNKFKTAMIHADHFSEQGAWTEAIKAYRFALAEFPNNEAAIIGFAKANRAMGQNDIAWRALQQVLKVNPVNYEALTYIGEIQEQTGQLDAAAETYLRVGNIFASQNDWQSAMEGWARAIELVPDKVDAHHKLSQALAQQGKTRPAARQLLTIAAIYQERGDDGSAAQYLHEAKTLLPKDPGVAAALRALDQGMPIQPDEIDENLDDFDLAPDFINEYRREQVFEGEDDPFAFDTELASGKSVAGLLETAQQNALAELANVIFEDEGQQPVAATISKDKINLLIMQGIDLQSRNQITEAINNYRQVTQAGAGRPALYFNVGTLYQQQGQFTEAAKMFKMAAQDKGYRISGQYALAETYLDAKNNEQALRHFLETLRIVDLENVGGSKAEALAHIYDKVTEEYLSQPASQKTSGFVTAVKKFFTNPNWAQKVAEARARMDSMAEDGSLMSLAEFLESPETEVIITTMALTNEYIKRNFLMTASEECLRAIQKAPLYLPLHIRLAEILLKQDHLEEAVTKYLNVARVYQMRQQPDQAINIYQKVVRLAPMDVNVRSKLIEMYVGQHNLELALEQYLAMADSHYQLAQVDRALERYNEALRLAANSGNPNTWRVEILNRIGDIYIQRFDWARATTAFEELLKINPQDERTQRQLVDLYFKQNKVAQATKILDGLLSTYQRYSPLKALELLKELTSIYTEDMALRQRLAVAYVQNGLKREAIKEYDSLGEMQLEHGLRSQAMQTIQAIINLGPDDPEGYRRLLTQLSGGAV